jgi:16S rRNA (uracil1498-N3)-methyltransferase
MAMSRRLRPGGLAYLLLSRSVHAEIRLYVPNAALAPSVSLSLTDSQRHYVGSVMRAKLHSPLVLFNGEDGEWMSTIEALDKKRCELRVLELLREQPSPSPAPTLLFGVLKGARMPTLVEKATELGVGELRVVTQ